MDKSLDGIIRRIDEGVKKIESGSESKLTPVYSDVVFELVDRGDVLVFGESDGVFYGYDNKEIYKSSDDWETKESIFSLPTGEDFRIIDYCAGAKILKNGRILIAATSNPRTEIYGFLYISDVDKENFTKVLDMPGGIPTSSWGMKDFGSYVFVSEYSALGRKAFMSMNGGIDWKMIYDRPMSDINTDQSCHVHDIGYDHYRNIVWVAFGDGQNRKLIYSHNFGETWIDLYPDRIPPIDPIGILVTPNYTLFGSDATPNGIDVLPHSDLTSTRIISHDDLIRRWTGSKDGGTITLVANATIIDGIYYYATTFSTQRDIATITCSPDGWSFYDVLNIDLGIQSSGVSGIKNIFDDGEGNLRCAVQVKDEGNRFKELIIKKPTFN